MVYEAHGPTDDSPTDTPASSGSEWPLWEVFVRARRGMAHIHAGSLHAPDAETALQSARDVYTRRQEGTSLWVVPSTAITAWDPHDDSLLASADDKPYRHPTFYSIPDEVGHM